MVDSEGQTEQRRDTVSLFNGPEPQIKLFKNEKEEVSAIAVWLKERLTHAIQSHECGVFVRSEMQLLRVLAALKEAQLDYKVLDERMESPSGKVAVGVMHLAKGLEFRVVVVMACDDEVVPLQERLESVGDQGDLKEVDDSERQLLYVAYTRAREHLLVTGVIPASEFLDDIKVH